MRITKVNIPKSYRDESIPTLIRDNGIEDIKMDRLGQIVLIAGKNGSGKTRLLSKITGALFKKPGRSSVKEQEKKLKQITGEIQSNVQRISDLQDNIKLTTKKSEIDIYQFGITAAERNLQSLNLQRDKRKKITDWNLVETNEVAETYSFVHFVPKSLDLEDSNNLGKNELIMLANSVSDIGVANLPKGTFAKIQYIQDRWFNFTHQNFQSTEKEKEKAIEDYEILNETVENFLNTSIDRDADGNAKLFGLPLGQTNLSDGQKVLLQFCVAIYSQRINFNDLILIMDEPENHLHPSVIVETIDQISKCVKNGQIWIATHSIPLLAHFDSSSIWYMEKGTVSYAGNIPEKVLESLLGDEEEIAKLQDFIGLPAQLALNHFAYECLFEPQAIVTGKDDPQVLQIRNQLGNFEKDGKIKILDYGAGKGRLLANIIENLGDNLQSFTNKFDYIAFDKFDDDKKDCEELLEKVYGSSGDRYFNDYKSLLSKHDKASFDIVIMSNVLHEIEPTEWLKLFSNDGDITSLLSENGILLLVEDTQVPVGEKAYQNGFIVLDTPDLKELFNMKAEKFVFDEARNGRLKCHVIPKNCLSRITAESRISALKSLHRTSREEIIKLRNADRNYRNGRLHGYYVQQLANTTLALSELTNG